MTGKRQSAKNKTAIHISFAEARLNVVENPGFSRLWNAAIALKQMAGETLDMNRIHPVNENYEPNILTGVWLLAQGQHTSVQLSL